MQRDAKANCMVLLSGDKEEQAAITQAIAAFNADLVCAPTIHHLRDYLFELPCNGLLFCIGSLVGLEQNGKSFIQTLEQVYPVARIRWNKTNGSFALIASRSGRIETLSDFVTICSNFAPRRLRRSERISKTLNVMASAVPDLADSTHAFTINISPRGCFLHTSREWKAGDSVFLQIQESSSRIAIEGRVTRYVPWGVPFCIQGIGIQFVNMSREQIEELQRLLYYMTPGHSEESIP